MKYVKKPVVVEAVQWFKDGDHPGIESYGEIKNDKHLCNECNKPVTHHGITDTFIVCPGDYIIEGTDGKYTSMRADVFEATFYVREGEPVEQPP